VGLQIVRDWVVRFNACGPDGLLDGKAPGARSRLDDAQRRALVETVERGPIPAIHGVVRWRLCDLVQWLHREFGVSLDETTVGRELKKLGYVKLTARPRPHAQIEPAMEAFKKGGFAAALAKVRRTLWRGTPIEIWLQSLPRRRPGTKPGPARRTGSPGAGPDAARGHRRPRACPGPDPGISGRNPPTCWASPAFGPGAICPEVGKGAGLVLPFCYTETMSLHLAEIALAIAPGAHGVVQMHQAGWHMSGRLAVPGNISIIPLPPTCPELTPVENVWQFIRDTWLSNRIFTSHDNIFDHCCEAWNKLVEQPWRITTIGRRQWTRGS